MIHDQTQAFLDENKIIYKFQSGFRKNFFTDSCLSYLNNKIVTGFGSGLYTGMILIDLQKAFDKNPIAFENFQNFSKGYRKSYLSWLHSAKRDATKEKRIAEIIRLCEANIKSRDTW